MTDALLWTPRFQSSYRKYSGDRQVIRVVRQAIRRKESVKDWYDGKRAMSGVDELVYELKVSKGHRALVQQDKGRLVLVDVGDHEITDRYATLSAIERLVNLSLAKEAPQYFLPGTEAPLFLEVDEPYEPAWAEEFGEEWLFFLSDEQTSVKNSLMAGVNKANSDEGSRPYVALVKGGAGTGKTALLLSIALDYAAAGWVVDFRCSEAVRDYLAQTTRVNMSAITQAPGQPAHLVLLDDPPSVSAVRGAINVAQSSGQLGVIAAFDPLQWREKHLSRTLSGLDRDREVFKLTTCYRQSSALLENAREVAAAINERSSWRIAKQAVNEERDLLRQLQAEFLDGLEPIKPGGRVAIHEASIARAIEDEAALLRARNDLWETMPALLVLEDRAHKVTTKKWAAGLTGIKRLTRDVTDVSSYKGLDFQAVWIFLARDYFDRIQQGKLGLSTAEWEALRDLHIPFTRAKDSTVIFVV